MADVAAPAPAKKVVKAKKPAVKPAHPAYAVMIVDAIKALKERGGSSRGAILKYIVANNKIADAAKAQGRSKLAIRKLLATKKLVPVKGSFKLAKEEPKPKKAKKVVKKKPAAKKAKKPSAKKAVKKTAVKAKKPAKKAAKKPAAKKPVAKKAAKKPAAKKPVAKKVAKKPAAKKVAKK